MPARSERPRQNVDWRIFSFALLVNARLHVFGLSVINKVNGDGWLRAIGQRELSPRQVTRLYTSRISASSRRWHSELSLSLGCRGW